jgi:hypothetical protein
MAYTNDAVLTPLQLDISGSDFRRAPAEKQRILSSKVPFTEMAAAEYKVEIYNVTGQPLLAEPAAPLMEHLVPVSFDEVDASLTKEDKEKVKSTIDVTRKVASTLQWKEIEASIAEVMDNQEKAVAKQEYLHELEKVEWPNIEQNLKANFDRLDWEAIGVNVAKAQAQVELDSLQNTFSLALAELQKTEANLKTKSKCSSSPTAMPDASIQQIQLAREMLQKSLAELKAAGKQKKVVHL